VGYAGAEHLDVTERLRFSGIVHHSICGALLVDLPNLLEFGLALVSAECVRLPKGSHQPFRIWMECRASRRAGGGSSFCGGKG
jgi:hypothetical protein